MTDMVAHTGNLKASILAVEVADECVSHIVAATKKVGGEVIITSDHGNVEELIDTQSGEVDTKHSSNPVPFIYVADNSYKARELSIGMLADLGPTILNLLGIDKPSTMIGRNLLP